MSLILRKAAPIFISAPDLNTGEHSLTLDPATPGADIFRKLAADADIFIENHPPGFIASLVLSYDALSQDPHLIMISIKRAADDHRRKLCEARAAG
jgi:crotonobetainyl-CoA:carnitine CoA-transferase CaiB-like acyl-CoA transferase